MEYQLQKITEDFSSIPITGSCLEKIKNYAKLSKRREIYGFLLNPMDATDGIVRKTLIASQQEVSGSSVNLEAQAAAISKSEIENLGMKTIGFWHSHAGFGTFHSSTDDTNLDQLYRDIAQNNEERIITGRSNYRYLDQKKGRVIYRLGDLEVAIKLKDPEKSCERRILNQKAINFPKDSRLGLVDSSTLGLYLRDGDIILQLDNIQDFSVSRVESEDCVSLGLAYSLVVNEGGAEYGEIAKVKWCGKCEESSVQIYKKCKTKIIDDSQDPSEIFSLSELEEEIKGRTKKESNFLRW
jgi:hypothetical protein